MKLSKKKKIFAALTAFSVLTGSAYAADTIVDITINQPYERTGIELGTDSYAWGEGSIATGKNSVAIGKGATATGNNETAATIQAKLEENRLKLQEIEDKQKSVKQMGDDLNALKIREQKTIEAGIRVEQIRKSKANAKNVWDNAETAWKDKVDGTADAIADHNRKLADLNSRLNGVSKLTHSDISTPEGLTAAAEELKGKAEQGTSMNLSVDFYKDYVSNYYKALGDLRLNNKVISDHGERKIIDQIQENPLHRDLDGIVLQYHASFNSGFTDSNYTSSSSSLNYSTSSESYTSSSSYSSTSSNSYFTARAYNSLGEYSIDKNGIARVNGLRSGGKQAYNGEIYQTYWDIKSDVVDQATFNKWNAAKEGWRSQIHDANRRSGDEVFGKFDTLTGGKSTTLFNMVTDMKFELVDLDYQICYYQGQYEATHDKTWLDKKRAALDQRQQKLNTNEQTIKDKYRELFGKDLPDTSKLFHTIGQNIKNQWKQENIVDIEEKNKITTDKLTGELERELGINKAAIQQYEKEIQNLRNKADQARKNFEGLNPSAEDLLLAREYERVAKELQDKADALKKEADELEELKKNLKLNELKDKGADAIAYGTNALVTGNAAIGIGKNVVVTGEGSIALGRQNTVSGTQSAAIGTNNTVTGDQTFVLGSGVITKAKNAVVLGAGSAGEDNTVSVGSAGKERKIINVASGQIEAASTDAVNGSQLYELAQNPSKATGMNKENWQQFLGDGTNTSGSKGLVTGDTLYNAVKDKADKTDITNAVKDKADTNLKNITDEGKTVIKNIAKDSVKVVDGTNTTVTEKTDKDGNKNYAVNVEANGKNEEGNTGLINGDTLYKAIKDVDVSGAVKNKADTNLKNITDEGKTVIKDIAKDSVKVVDGTNTKVTEKTDKNGNKNYAVNIEANGKIEKNNNNIVTGGTVYQAIEDKIQDKSLVKTDGKIISIDKDGTADVIDVSHTVNSKTERRIISGVITDPKNPYSVANVSYVNTSISNVVQEMSFGMKRLEKDLGNAGAGAAALSALEYDEIEPGQKWQIAAGVGNYKGSTAYALGAKYHLNNDISFHIGSTIGNGNNMVNGGFSIALGHAKKKIDNDSMKRLDEMQKEINDLKEQNKQLIQALEKVNKLFLLNPSKKASFPDVPADHWAKNAVDVLHGNGAIEGYPDGNFKGDRKMSRYEYAEMLYNALMNGAAVDESVVEKYQPELVQIYSEKNR